MPSFKIDILRELKRLSNPYVDINNVSSDYNIRNESFTSAYLQLESEDLIASANTSDCGLEVGSDGLASWSVVNVYVTEKGDLALNPPKSEQPSFISVLTNNATFATVVGGILLFVILFLFVQPWLNTDQTQNQDTTRQIK